jgi:hypothetical protein
VSLRPELARIVLALVEASAASGEVTLDEIGDALGVLAVSQEEIEAVLQAIEAAGRRVMGPEGGNGEATLGVVLDVARGLRLETGKAPTATQIAAKAGLPVEKVRHALALARVIAK